MIRALALLACLLAVCITTSSAFIRHSQAGLGCAGWPQCHASAATASAQAAEPTPAVRTARGLHRISAMLIGVLALVIVSFGWSKWSATARLAALIALADTIFLAWLGRYTPHDLPLVTVGNLVGGLLLAMAFAWLAAERSLVAPGKGSAAAHGGARGDSARVGATVPLAFGALVLLALLAWIGTMIGARHAIDACDGVLCAGGVRFELAAFDPTHAQTSIDAAAGRSLHLVHRLLGLTFAVVVLLLVRRLRTVRGGGWLLILLVAQVALGIGTSIGTSPLLTATLHNALAAILAGTLAALAALRTSSRS